MPDLTSLGAILLSLAVLGYYLFFHRHKMNEQRLVRAVDALREALYTDLYLDLLRERDQGAASRLAATAVNEAFGAEPPDGEAAEFLKENRPAVQAELSRLAANAEVRPLIAAALKHMDSPVWKNRPRPKGGLKRGFNLGLVAPADQEMPVHQFLGRVAAYHRLVNKRMKAGG